MAAYAALASLAQTTDLNRNQHQSLFSVNAKEKIRSIHDYVASLLGFLEYFPDKANRWEGKMRDLAYDTEEIIESLIWRKIESRHKGIHLLRDRLEDRLENLTEEIGLIAGEVTEERPTHLSAAASSSSRLASSPSANDAVIGLHDDQIAIKDRLCGQSSNLQVVPIVGMGGIGKTTLARTVYDDPLIIEHFEIRAWVIVSQDYTPHRFRKILSGLVDSMKLSRQMIDESEIATKVFQNLKYMRYLIVLDDVWDTGVWDEVSNIFPDDNNGSRIMLTTRLFDVAAYPDSNSPLHEMRFMNDSQSWDLLKEKLFTNSCSPPDLEDVGKEIARRCAGLPLAVILVAGVLSAVNKTRAFWEEIAKNVNLAVDREIEKILSLSYTHLPHHLRPCFLLIGGFLEDVNIRTSRLIKLWVAEGFLKHKNECNESLEEEAEEYLEDLVKRNLIIVTSRKSNGKIMSCSLHDMVRDFCISKAQEEKFLHDMDGRDLPQGLMNKRRISFSRCDIYNIWDSTIRTILCFQFQNFPSWLALLGNYKLLRVLDALGVDLQELPSQVFELYHLRYLALMGSFCIPSTISNLVNLQTLIIHLASGKLRRRYWIDGESVSESSLPLEIWRMPQLRHLVFYAPYMLPHPLDESNLHLQNLQTLLLVIDLVWDEKIRQMIPNVRRLGLVYTCNEDYRLHHLEYLHQLERLEVIGYQQFSWRGQNTSFPRTLKKLTLVGGGFPWTRMAIVGSLPNLEVLKLLDYACDGETWEAADEEFPELKFLLIDGSRLRKWITHTSSFPKLKRLVLRFCWFLTEIPEGVRDIQTLELIEVGSCRKSLLQSAMQMKEYQECCGNDALQVRASHEDIQSCYKRKNLLSDELEDELRNVTEEIGLTSWEMAIRLAYLAAAISSSSRLAPTGKDAVIGLDDDLMAIKNRLCGMSSELRVIPIVGKGGIGKTTLARTVYYDPLIMGHFHIRAWVTISRDYSPEEILLHLVYSMKLLEQMSKQKIDESEVAEEVCENLNRQILGKEIDLYEMATQVHKNLKGRRYLIVMDDVWSTEVWDGVRNMFPNDDNGSRIILTTRLLDVATYPDSTSPLHEMRFMNDSQSWNLFKEKVFTNSNCPPDLENVGKEIARRCAGLPLLVVLVAGFLSAVYKTRHSWEEIVKSVNPVVGRESDVILSLSYTHLPYLLRPCFLFIGGFPEDADICASKLIKLWVAEGFLNHKIGCSISLEAQAEEYLEDLGNRNLVIVNSRKSDGKIKSCSLHDMVRDLCIRKAKEEKALHIVDRCVNQQGMKNEERISFDRSHIDKIWGPTIHTIICFQHHGVPSWVAFSGCSRFLEALDFWGHSQDELPSKVFELFNLRYLALNVSSKIPSLSGISNLVNLQTLIIHPTFRQRKRYWRYVEGLKRYWRYDEDASVIYLPFKIWSMPQLRHIVFYYLCVLPHLPDGSNLPLQHLQTLSPVKNLVWTEKIVQMIPNVKRLRLVYTINPDYHLHHLKDLHQLEKLEIDLCRYFSWWGQNPSLPRTLKKLTLVGGGFPWQDRGIIGSLPNLEVLKLLDYACLGGTWKTNDEEFPQLKFLLIDKSHLRQWITQSSHLPSLKCLVLRACRDLIEIPKGIGEIPTLELIEVDRCRKSVVESAKQIKEDEESCRNCTLRVHVSNELLEEQDG